MGRNLLLLAFVTVLVRAAMLPYIEDSSAATQYAGNIISSHRADIVDRNNLLLATNMPVHSLYTHPHKIESSTSAARIVDELAEILPEFDKEKYLRKMTGNSPFVWIADKLSPEQHQAILEIGEVGLEIGRREARVYPNGTLASHLLGGSSYGDVDANAAQIKGVAGLELQYEDYLSNRENSNKPLVLSLDLMAQKAVEDVLTTGVDTMNANGGAAVLMDVHSGEIYALASNPDFDPNWRGSYDQKDKTDRNPLFHRAAQGLLELGSVFKVFAVATALELDLVEPDTIVDTRKFLVDGYQIRDAYSPRNSRTVTEIITKSSNVGVARLALEFGASKQREFLNRFGFGEPVNVAESRYIDPGWPSYWAKSTTATVAYGYGVSVTPIHLAAAYSMIVNGGFKVVPTMLRRDSSTDDRESVLSQETSRELRNMLRLNVEEGSATSAQIAGYTIGGKTGTALKLKKGKYTKNKVYSVFAACFPADDPRFVLIVVLDEPNPDGIHDILAGNTVVPVAAEMITRLSSILGIRPKKKETPVRVARLQ